MKWPGNLREAREIQQKLKQKVKISPLAKKTEVIAGVDAAFSENNVIAVVCLYTYPLLIHIADAYATTKIPFPYIPGFLSFREGPAVIKALNKLRIRPDTVLFDGQGIAHPAGIGIATHIGALLNIPAIGCAKSRLVGNYRGPGMRKGQYSNLIYQKKIIGAVLRTRDNVKPVFVSPGHLIDLKAAIDIVIKCTGKYRIPEPLRRADNLSKKLKKALHI